MLTFASTLTALILILAALFLLVLVLLLVAPFHLSIELKKEGLRCKGFTGLNGWDSHSEKGIFSRHHRRVSWSME